MKESYSTNISVLVEFDLRQKELMATYKNAVLFKMNIRHG